MLAGRRDAKRQSGLVTGYYAEIDGKSRYACDIIVGEFIMAQTIVRYLNSTGH
jgi:hypothetical protein